MWLNRSRFVFRTARWSRSMAGLGSTASKKSAETQASAKQVTQEKKAPKYDIDELLNLDNANIVTRHQKKLPERPPLVKNFFCGVTDLELLAYPEAIEKADLEKLNESLKPITQFFGNTLDSEKIRSDGKLSDIVYKDLKQLKSFGMNIPEQFGGTGYYATETCMVNEAEAVDVNAASTLNAHRVIATLIQEHGSEIQKDHYLRKMAKGELVASFGIFEEQTPEDYKVMNTHAEHDPDDNKWVLNGEKNYVINSSQANVLLVFAQTRTRDKLGDSGDSVTAFLVDASDPGVTICANDKTIGCEGLNQSTVKFNDVVVPGANVLSDPGDGHTIGEKLLFHSRIQSGIVNVVQMRKILSFLTQECIKESQNQTKLRDIRTIKEQIARACCKVYAAESMIYLTAGIVDQYEKPQVDLETAIIKVFTQQSLLDVATIGLNFLNAKATKKGHPLEQSIRDAVQLYSQGEPLDAIKLFIGFSGLQWAGMQMYDDVRKKRNPLFNPKYMAKQLLNWSSVEEVKTSVTVNEYLHPTMDPGAQRLEHSVVRMKMGTEILFVRHGRDIFDRHNEVNRLAEAAAWNFIMYASLARASRSYCIGLKWSDYECLIANTICYEGFDAVKQMMIALEIGPQMVGDDLYQEVATKMFDTKGYFPTHPTTRNY